MEVISSENLYLAESPRLEEPVQSLYADEPPPKGGLNNQRIEAQSKLAETVGIENTIMLNADDLVKATARSVPSMSGDDTGTSCDQNDKNFGVQPRQTRTYAYGTSRRRGAGSRRRYCESQRSPPDSDINLGNATAETRTSVIRGLTNRKRKTTSSESESEASLGEKEEMEKTDYGNLRCYEQFEKDTVNTGDSLSARGNYIQNTNETCRIDASRNMNTTIKPDTSIAHDRVSENLNIRGPVSSGARCVSYPMSIVDTRTYPQAANVYRQQHVHDLNTQFRMQHPPEYPISQVEQRGKHFFDRTGRISGQSSGGAGMVPQGYTVNPHGKFGIPDNLYVQTHGDLPYGGGYSVYETRSPTSSTSSGKDREQAPEQEGLKTHVQHFSSPVSNIKEEHGQASPLQNTVTDLGVVGQGKMSDEMTDNKQLDSNKNIKGKRNQSGKTENANRCVQCWKTFASSSALAKHKLTHSDERRYSCSICRKAFKRQDHLNGHMLTHRDKKPYECKFADCDKSYCDMRSLRRHYENYHPNPDSMQPIQSSTGSFKHENEQMAFKVRPHPDECFLQDGEENQGSPQSVQEVSFCGKSKQEVPQGGFRRKRNSDSMCSDNSEDLNKIHDSHSPHQSRLVYNKPTSGMSMLKQVVEPSQDLKGEKPVVDGYSLPGYYQLQDGYNSQWYPYQPQMIQMYQTNAGPVMISQPISSYGQLPNNAYCPTDPPQMVPNYPAINPGPPSRTSERKNDDNTWINARKGEDGYRGLMVKDSGAPTDPTSVAIVNAKDLPKQVQYKEGNGFPPAVQWKTVSVNKDSSGMPPFSMGNNPTSMQYPPVNVGINLPDRKTNHDQSTALNISIPPNQGEKRLHEMDHRHIGAKRHCPAQTLPLNIGEERLLKLGDGNMKPPNSTESPQDELFRNPPATPPRKPRPKPDPIHIPCSNYSGSPLSPPIYTPPPMLSPRSIFHISSSLTPRCGGSTPLTPSRFFLGNRSRKNSLDGGETVCHDQLPEVLIPEPKINIGAQFQADVPTDVDPRNLAEFDKHRAAVCWTPFEHETKKRSQEIEAFLDMACSVAVHGGGSNKEYALHVLFRLKGNIKQAVRHILANKSAIQKGDGLADYHYEGSEKWSARERLKFREALGVKGKDFFQISKEVETKSVSQCVEFYYLWKATHPEAMRSRTRYAEMESESENIEYFSDNDGNSTLVFECDFPECNSKFISRQALNGHIRVHGGSFMKPSEPKRVKVKPTNPDNNNSNTSGSTNAGRAVTKPPKPPTSSNASVVPNGDGTLPEFACKVCGRIFHKIKSRSAHMKTHVKRSDDDRNGASK